MSSFGTKVVFLGLAIVLSFLGLGLARTSPAAAGGVVSSTDDVTVRVEVWNQLPGLATFTIHCKSEHEDLRTHEIQSNQNYAVEFIVDLGDVTHFSCDASWEGGQTTFVVYDAKRDIGRCQTYCKWEATGDSINGYPQTQSTADISVPWGR